MQMCGLGIVGHQQTGHHQVASHLVLELLRQALQRLPGMLVQVLGAHVIRDRRAVVDLLRGSAVALFLTAIATRLIRLAVTARCRGLAVTARRRRLAITALGGFAITTSGRSTASLTCRFTATGSAAGAPASWFSAIS